jgi:hypothetical protein
MEAVTWAALGILAAGQLGTLFYLGAKLDGLGGTLGSRIDSLATRLDARIDAQTSRIDQVSAQMAQHLERHAG